MAISYVGGATGVDTAVAPTTQNRDVVVAFAFRDGSTTPPTVPVGWTTIDAGGNANSCSSVLVYRIISGLWFTGTFTNATSFCMQVYRGCAATPIGVNNRNTAGSSSTVNYAALTLNRPGNSWILGFAGISTTNTSLQTAPGGMINRTTVVDLIDEAAGHDTNGYWNPTTWPSTNVSVGGTAGNWSARTLELQGDYFIEPNKPASAPSTFISVGNAAVLKATRKIVPETGVYNLTGNDVILKAARRLTPDTGVYNFTGNDASLVKSWLLNAEPGVYILNGNDAELIRTTIDQTGSKGWIPVEHYRSYRKKLEKLIKIAEERESLKYKQLVIETNLIAKELKIELPEVQKSVDEVVENIPLTLNMDLFHAELLLIAKQLELIIMEADDENALILII